MAVPIHIVSGFLGSGKTSAIRAQIEARAGERLAVVVNDFGEAALDEAALAGAAPFRLLSIGGACVCCTAPEGFVAALGAVLEGDPERILVEPTGLARPRDLVDTLRRSPQRARLRLGPVVVLVDPARLGRLAAEERAVAAQQVEAADVLVANRTDLCSAEDLERFDAFAAGLWPPPLAVHHATFGRLAPEVFEWPAGEGPRLAAAASAAGPAPSTAGFAARSWRWPATQLFSRERLAAALEALAGGEAGAPLARLKGVFHTGEGVFQLEVAGGRLHEAPSSHRRDSRADAIFRSRDGQALAAAEERLRAALLGPAEREARAHEIEIALPDGRQVTLDRDRLARLPEGVSDVSQLFPKRAGSAARLRSLWRALGLPPGGRAVVCAADGFASDPIAVAALCEGVLLHSLGGGPLPEEKGGPFRLLVPEGVAGAPASCANVKGVVRIVLRG